MGKGLIIRTVNGLNLRQRNASEVFVFAFLRHIHNDLTECVVTPGIDSAVGGQCHSVVFTTADRCELDYQSCVDKLRLKVLIRWKTSGQLSKRICAPGIDLVVIGECQCKGTAMTELLDTLAIQFRHFYDIVQFDALSDTANAIRVMTKSKDFVIAGNEQNILEVIIVIEDVE